MANVKGVVHKTFANNVNGKTLHSFTLRGVDGFFSTGERQAPVEVGKSYEFETNTSPSGRISVSLSTLRPWESGEALDSPPVRGFRGAVGGNPNKSSGSDQFWKNKEERDVKNDRLRELGATRNTALTLVSLMLSNGAVKLPAKENSKEEVIYSLFEHYTQVLLEGQGQKGSDEGVSVDVPEATASVAEEASWK